MSRESAKTLNTDILVGYGVRPWWLNESLQALNAESSLYAGAIPVGDIQRRLFHWTAEPRRVAVEVPATVETMTHLSADGHAMRWEVQLDRKAISRSDTDAVMGLFKDGYEPHQYDEWLLGAVSNILGDSLGVGSAGLLKGGAVAWVQVETPETHTNPQGFAFRPRLLGGTSFDGSIATFWKRVFGIVVCDNTMEAARGEDGAVYKIKHTRNSNFKLKDARSALGLIEQGIEEFDAQIEALSQITVTDRQWQAFLDELSPLKDGNQAKTGRSLTLAVNKQDELKRLWLRDNRVTPWKGTALGVLQATNTWGQHLQTVRGSGRPERNMLNVIKGETAKSDNDTLSILGRVLSNA